jgi:tetratricopeptide (TPR) repeat protein
VFVNVHPCPISLVGELNEYLQDTLVEELAQKARGLALKLALVLVPRGAADEAERCAREAGEGLAANAVLAWLHWRAGSSQAKRWLERAQTLIEPRRDRWAAGVSALLTDLAGEWEAAKRAFLSLDRPTGAALAACRQGDQLLEAGDSDQALDQYRQAVEIWEQENDAIGLALAHYRTAEAYWRRDDAPAAQAALAEASTLLDANKAAADEDCRAIADALTAVAGGEHGPWKPWRWQAYDDAFRISILFLDQAGENSEQTCE